MRRRRSSGRTPGKFPHLGPLRTMRLQAGSLRALRRANRLLEVGDHANAAAIFIDLAVTARDLGMEERAPFIFFQAARAFFLAGNPQEGMGSLRDGLDILAKKDQPQRLKMIGERLMQELDQLGFTDSALQVRKVLEGYGVQPQKTASEPGIPPSTALPLKCPNCGATLRPDSVEWIDRLNAVCSYCGSVVRQD